jgi:hypothetical protein
MASLWASRQHLDGRPTDIATQRARLGGCLKKTFPQRWVETVDERFTSPWPNRRLMSQRQGAHGANGRRASWIGSVRRSSCRGGWSAGAIGKGKSSWQQARQYAPCSCPCQVLLQLPNGRPLYILQSGSELMILPIRAYGDPVLKKVAKDIEPGHLGLKQLIADMFETMYAASGVGLAAPQIGQSIRLFIVDASPFAEDEEGKPEDART